MKFRRSILFFCLLILIGTFVVLKKSLISPEPAASTTTIGTTSKKALDAPASLHGNEPALIQSNSDALLHVTQVEVAKALEAYNLAATKFEGTQRLENLRGIVLSFVDSAKLEDIPAFLAEIEHDDIFAKGGAEFIRRAAKLNPALVWSWLSQTSNSAYSTNFTYAAGNALEPETLLSLLRSGNKTLPESEQRRLYEGAFVQLSSKDLMTALTRLGEETQMPSPVMLDIQGQCVRKAIQSGQEESALNYLNQITDISRLAFLAEPTVNALSTISPSKTADWLVQHQDLPNAGLLAERLTSKWTLSDSVKASQWINSLPEGIIKQHSITSLIDVLILKAPDEITPWVSLVQDEKRRLSYINTLNNRRK